MPVTYSILADEYKRGAVSLACPSCVYKTLATKVKLPPLPLHIHLSGEPKPG
jgi:hypothetical protein